MRLPARRAATLATAFLLSSLPGSAARARVRHLVRDNSQWSFNMEQANQAVQKNQLPLAEIKFTAALKVAESMDRDDPRGVAVTLWSLANVELSLKEYDRAERHFSRALLLEERAPDSDEIQMSEHFRAVGNFYMQQQKFRKAKTVYERAIYHAEIAREETGRDPDWRNAAASQLAMATAALKAGEYKDAEPAFEKAKSLYEKVPGGIESDEDRRFILRALQGQADSWTGLKKYAQAEPLYQHVLELDEKAFGKKDPALADACEAYAKMLRAAKRGAEAKKIDARAREIRTPEKTPF